MMAETSPIFGSNPSKPAQDPLFYDKADTPKTRALQIAFVSCVIIAVGITFILSIVRALQEDGIYILLFVSLISFAQTEVFLFWWIRKGDVPKEKFNWLYIIGFCVLIESIFTDILLFHA
ncbi:uncharacterized protein LOC134194815 [Corticium candelabrum]|uniref:uncharacterized protein LOC134194815 n=1 Tax=Corticium candelabrum TaxID=121492 RepID=UPI002E253B45|nr:uncharacterized protein LOC134194815 [Corticium candelabrum]